MWQFLVERLLLDEESKCIHLLEMVKGLWNNFYWCKFDFFADTPEEGQTCHPPTEPVNGSFQPEMAQYDSGAMVRYMCNKGFTLKGRANATCNSAGQWMPPHTPTCEGKFCQTLYLKKPSRIFVVFCIHKILLHAKLKKYFFSFEK